jgi:hypothetical protein
VTAAKQPDREIALDRVRIRETAARTIEAGLGYGISALFVCEGLLSNGDPVPGTSSSTPTRTPGLPISACRSRTRPEFAGMVEHHAEESQIALPA